MSTFNFRNVPRALALIFALRGSSVIAQQYTITTIAGGAPPATPVTAINTSIGQPRNTAVDSAGNIYFSSGNSVFKLDSAGNITLIAGNSQAGYSGDGGLAIKAQLNQPAGIAFDSAKDIYIADSLNNVVRIVTPDGLINTFAGNGTPGYSGDTGSANQAQLDNPIGIAVDKSGNLYIADNVNHAVRKVTTDGNINTFAGNQVYSFGYLGDGAAATQGQLTFPTDVAIDSTGNVYIADFGNFVIRQVTTDGKIHTYAGNNTDGYTGDGGVATSASLYQPWGIALDSSGNLYITEYGDAHIRKVASGSAGKISTIAGNGTYGFSGDGSAATSAALNIPRGLCIDSGGNLYIADWGNNRVRKIASGGTISTVAGNGILSYSGDGGLATKAQLNAPQAVAVDAAGNVYIADTANNVVRQVNSTGAISTFAGNGSPGYGGDGGPAAGATFYLPSAVAVDKAGNVYIADYQVGVVRKVSTSGTISTVAGIGATGYSGDGGPATKAQLNGPSALALDPSGNLYIAQLGDSRIRVVSPQGIITTIAGTGADGYQGEGLVGAKAQLAGPDGIAVDSAGNVFISMVGSRVMKLSTNGYVSTIAGTGTPGYSGDGMTASGAMVSVPAGLALDSSGNLYIADSGNNAVRMLSIAGYGLSISGVTNAASNRTGPISPGEIVVVYGSGLGPAKLTPLQLDSNGRVTSNLGGTRILFNGTPAPILYSAGTQVSAVAPFGLTGTTAQVTAQYGDETSTPISVTVAPVSPAIFTADSSGQGQALANNADGSYNSAANPVQIGSTLTFFATGAGQMSPATVDGTILNPPLPYTALPVSVTIGGKAAIAQYAAGVPNNVAGSVQINVIIPSGIAAGSAVPVVMQVGGVSDPPGVTIAVAGS